MTGTIVAATTQQKLGVAVALILIVGWVAYLLTHLKRAGYEPGSEVELAPNRKPYFDDDVLETKKLDRSLGTALVLLVVVAIGLPLYWVRETGREAGAQVGFDERSVERGYELFQPTDSTVKGTHFGCGTCHGVNGAGGSTTATIADYLGRQQRVSWKAPSLNNVGYRYANPASDDEKKNGLVNDNDPIRIILVYGRPGTPMPAWGVKGGGPMNDQQINDLVNFLRSPRMMLSLEDAKKEAAQQVKQQADAEGGSPTDGKVLFDTNCARCHTRGWSYGQAEISGGGAYGKNLRDGDTLRQFPDEKDHIDFIKAGAPYAKPYGKGGVGQNAGGGMPGFGAYLSDDEIKKIVDYERSL